MQHDGAPTYIKCPAGCFLNEMLTNPGIRRDGPFSWPPKFANLASWELFSGSHKVSRVPDFSAYQYATLTKNEST